MTTHIHVRVPATTANLGPGFDSLGLALTLHNHVRVRVEGLRRSRRAVSDVRVEVRGLGAGRLPSGPENLVWRAAARVLAECGLSARSVALRCLNRIPLQSGLGSSAAACVAGLVAADALAGGRLGRERLLEIAAEMEGHADNAAAALWGGLTVCYDAAGTPRCVPVRLRARLAVVAAVPDMELATSKARGALPRRIPHRDAALAVGRAAAIVALLARGDVSGLDAAMQDTLHQPYRSALVPGMMEALRLARRRGALAAALSGSGPSLVAFTPCGEPAVAKRVAAAFARAFRSRGLAAWTRVLRVDRGGARVLRA